MPVELAGISLEHLTHVSVKERARIVRHPVPGMSGDLAQTLGRSAVEVQFHGIFYGETATDDLQQLRNAYLEHQPVDFFTEAVGEGYFSRVLISRLEVSQRANFPSQFDFVCQVMEYVEPPEPAIADPFGDLNTELLGEATAFIDDVQNALEQVSQLTDLMASFPNFGNPTVKLPEISGEFLGLAGESVTALSGIRSIF
jgi:hypothetical protein